MSYDTSRGGILGAFVLSAMSCPSGSYTVNIAGAIAIEAFYNCDSLTAIYCEASEKSIDWSPNCFNNAKVYFAGQWEYVNGVPTPIN